MLHWNIYPAISKVTWNLRLKPDKSSQTWQRRQRKGAFGFGFEGRIEHGESQDPRAGCRERLGDIPSCCSTTLRFSRIKGAKDQ